MNVWPPPALVTSRLYVRAVEAEDIDLLVSLQTDSRVREFLGGTVEPERALHRARFGVSAENAFVVVERASGSRLGHVSFGDHDHGDLELSYAFVPDSWGKGFAVEAVQAAIAWATDALAVGHLEAVTQKANLASTRLLKRFGASLIEEFEEFGAMQARYRVPVA